MRRLLLGLTLAAVAAAVAAEAGGATGSIPRGFRPDTAAAFGARDVWLLGGKTLLRSTDGGRHFARARLPRHLWSGSGTIPRLAFADSHDGYAYAAGWLFSTHDGGESWHRSLAGDELGFTVGGGYAYAFIRRRGLERSPVPATTGISCCRCARSIRSASPRAGLAFGSSGPRRTGGGAWTRSGARAIAA
jgi:hypothetical protein